MKRKQLLTARSRRPKTRQKRSWIRPHRKRQKLQTFLEGLTPEGMLGNVLALGAAFTFAIVYLAARRTDCGALSYSYQGNLASAVLALCLPFDPGVSADITPFLAALGLGVALTLGYLFFSLGMKRGVPPVTAAIVSNIEPILNPTWCFLFLGEFPGVLSIVGALIVLTAVTAYTILSLPRKTRA